MEYRKVKNKARVKNVFYTLVFSHSEKQTSL